MVAVGGPLGAAADHTGNRPVMPSSDISVGQLRCQAALDSEAVYRVRGLHQGHVEVEVVHAPGLWAGQRFRFTVDAVAAMDVVGEDGQGESGPAGG
jgi:hypothetical protein